MKYALGVDIGGTNIRVAVVNEKGELFDVIKERTVSSDGSSLANHIIALINKIDYKKYNVLGIGIGVPGPVDKNGLIQYLANLNISTQIDLISMLRKSFNLPIFIGNDANVAGLAEAIVGNGVGHNVVQYITLSTGIGGGLIIDKKMITGTYGYAQEIGSMVIKNGGKELSKLKPKGCIESEASGTALVNKALEKGLKVEHAGQIFELASQGNKIALHIKNEFIDNIAAFLGSMVAYIEPDIFVLGGGVMKSKDYFLKEVIARVDDFVPVGLRHKINIVCAKYSQDCGIIGAAMQVFKENV